MHNKLAGKIYKSIVIHSIHSHVFVPYGRSKHLELCCIFFMLGVPSKPTVAVRPGPLIKLGVNNYVIRMRCLPHDNNFSYKWERKNNQLPSNALYINTEQLTIANLKPGDSGEYRCIMSNSTGQIASNYTLVTVKGLIYC